ncbi:uncharacterized protein [Acropora muricata]|uniref:uncharacterized protein n=1 Tax=Acropora muricata TaxID=159855 RepID=UPI0034E50321
MSSFVSWKQQNAYSESTCFQDELDDCGDTNQLERDGSDTSANDCEDESLTPDLWEKMSCGDGLHEDSDGLDAVDCNNGLELADCYRESLLGELNFNEEIPDMECFKNTPAASSEDQEPLRDEQALYQDSPLSVAESSLLLMAFSVRHKLSGVALEDLLELIQLHCPKPNKCITELKEFQLFFQALKHPVVKHYYCPNLICKLYVGTSKPENTSKCAVCGTPLTSSFYFIEIPIVEQLRTILSGPGMIKKLQYRFSRTKIDPGAIEDVYDGELYKKHSCPGGFLSNQHNISFLGNTDGVALIRSNGYGVWPVYLVVNEIPPSERFRRCNRIFAGLWFGKGKPHFPTFLRPFSLAIRELYYKGVEVANSISIKAIFLDMSVDAPARASWQAIKQYNGYWGCGHCKEPGEHLDLGPGKKNRRRMCHVYPFNKAFAATTGHAGPRKHNEVKEQAIEALRQKGQGQKDFAVEGIIGLSWGFGLPLFDVIRGTVVDYMHCVCEGVIDQLISRWLDKSNSKLSFYLGSKVEEISKELTAITPTCEITRTPRSLADVKDWKASEKRAFLLYYATPLLSSYLPSDHLFFLMLLTGGVFRLLKQSITQTELQEAHAYLKLFSAQAPVFYGKQFQTFNVHQLLHLAEVVRDLGPLWSNSCFPFEDYNGDLRELFHGTKNVDGQIVTAVSVIQKLPEIARSTKISTEVMAFYEHLTSKRCNAR